MGKPYEIIVELRAAELGLDIENLTIEIENEFYKAIDSLAHAAHAKIMAKAQETLNKTRPTYLKDLKFDKIGAHSYLITLEGEFSNKIEEGFAGTNIKANLLNSTKTVKVGSRAGQPWVQESAKGHRFAHVPFERKPFSKSAQGNDLDSLVRQITIKNSAGRKQKLTSLFKDPSGKPLEGKVAVVTGTGIKDLESLVKYQKTRTGPSGKTKTESFYVNYRTVSDNPEANSDWLQKKAWPGLKAFDEIEAYVEEQMDLILKDFLG